MDYSVVVAGGGPAGSLAALRLASAGARVIVVDCDRSDRAETAEILSPDGREILEREKLWQEMPLDLTWPCPSMAAAWDRPDLTWSSFEPHPCAWHVDRTRFDAWMTRRIRTAGVDVEIGRVARARRHGDGWRIDVDAGAANQTIACDFLVLATGRSTSAIRLAPRRRIDNLCLVAGTTAPDSAEPDALIIEATADGWWYSAPLVDGRLFTGWMTDFSLIGHGRYEEAAAASLKGAPVHARRIGRPRLSKIVGSATWVMSPCAGTGWIAIGDAAIARDPISGDGLVSALRSAREGADAVVRALNGDRSVWLSAAEHGEGVATRYEERRLDLYQRAAKRWPSSTFWRRFAKPSESSASQQLQRDRG